ncbi:hypothetical protein CHS0354_005384 [Potamilus streckersoni]|uniref:Uncharacterized protein n=1 Tax=Potamilus streckersoni TaxID=2493646 RepID=A0AAE0SJT7_9BIVA|nr:hypothetical protein CHS0354_005384 [Potamilus streckersoni]
MSCWTRLVARTHFTSQSPICSNSFSVIHNFRVSCRTLRNMMEGKKDSTSNINTTSWPIIGICQLTCTEDKDHNFHTCESLIRRAKTKGAQMVFLPEACDFIGQSKSDSFAMAEALDGSTISRYKSLAKELGVWLSLGGFHQKVSDETDRVFNTHVIIDADGGIQATYNKTHLFDLDIKGKVRLCESDYTIQGREICPPVQTPVGKIGLATCYDLRFPELSLGLTAQGAEILTFPSAFTVTTGMAHWEVLLRSRAIECQCYVVAAAQTGSHNSKRSSYGHAMIVDPWGTVVAQCREGTDVCVAELDLDYLRKVRTQMPVAEHRRHDLYGHINFLSRGLIDSNEYYQFGKIQISCKNVFFRSSQSFAFVNIKPVVPGHILV